MREERMKDEGERMNQDSSFIPPPSSLPNVSPSSAPAPKVIASAGGAGLGGAIGAVVVWAMGAGGLDVPPEIGIALSTICSILVSFAAGYFTPPRSV